MEVTLRYCPEEGYYYVYYGEDCYYHSTIFSTALKFFIWATEEAREFVK